MVASVENALAGKELFGELGAPYLPVPGLAETADAARLLGLPLLLTGDPGCGKSEFAYACARLLLAGNDPDWNPHDPQTGLLAAYVRSDTTSRSLLYEHDAVARFADANFGQATERAKDPRHYIRLQALGVGLASAQQRVVLVDEIDKAPRDLPNDLLRELHRFDFEITEISRDRQAKGDVPDPDTQIPLRRVMGGHPESRPFVIFTSNEERSLPDAFLRRCVYFHIPDYGSDTLQSILVKRAIWRDATPPDPQIVDACAVVYDAIRAEHRGLHKRPSVAEFIHWHEALRAPSSARHIDQFTRAAAQLRENKSLQGPVWSELPFLGLLVKSSLDMALLQRS